jgi:membrane protease subunit HflK
MSWNNGNGPNPWGNPGGNPGGPSGGSNEPPKGSGNRPENPWGGGPSRGPGSGGGLPDLDDLIARMQDKARRFVPGGPRGPGGPGGMFGRGGGRLYALIAIAAVAIWLASGFYRVQPDEQGVVLRFGAFSRTTLPGLNYHAPWPVESVLTPAVTRINRVEVGFRGNSDPIALLRAASGSPTDSAREIPQEALMLTGDENIIDINFSVFWRIRDAQAFLFNTRNPEDTVKSAAESMMRQVIGRTPIQPALTDARARIEQDVTTGTQAILDQYGTGVEVTQVQLQRVDPPAAVIDSFRDVQRATTDAERVRNEAESYRNDIIPRARGDAARLTAEAEGSRQAIVAEANGQAQRFLSVYQAYTVAKDITLRRLYIETMQQILTSTPSIVVDDKLQGIVPYLPLDQSRVPTAPRPVPPGQAAAQGPVALPGVTR